MKPKYVYVAGPYSSDPVLGTRAAIEAADWLAQRGFVPFIPHLTHFWHFLIPHPYEFWLEQDLEWLKKCDALLRLPGESSGADREVTMARTWHIPVFFDVADLLDWRPT